jgi:hypothetical protein
MQLSWKKCEYLSNDKDRGSLVLGAGRVIDRVKKGKAMRYLGLWVDEKLTMKIHAEKVVSKVMGKLEKVSGCNVPLSFGVQLINECVTPVIQFSARQMPMNRDALERLERAYKSVLVASQGRWVGVTPPTSCISP